MPIVHKSKRKNNPYQTAPKSWRQKFFHRLYTRFPNVYILYTLIAMIFIWNGVWEYIDEHIFPMYSIWRNTIVLLLGLTMIYADSFHLKRLSANQPDHVEMPSTNHWLNRFFEKFELHYPNLFSAYIYIAILFVWYGVWNLANDLIFPQQPMLRQCLLVIVGFGMLYLEDLNLQNLGIELHRLKNQEEEQL
jgi:hypothetical protein